MNIEELTIKSFSEGIREGRFSAEEITREFLGTIEKKNGELNAYLDVYEKDAISEAKYVDEATRAGKEISALAGVPIAIKDNILISGKRTTAGSKILENYIASYDATVSEKLKDAHAVFLGKTNLDEFAMGSSTENSAYGAVKNPVDVSRVPGGSSGGSAAVVAGGLALASLGSDTGGSVRQPAAFCGVVGLKPTYGAVSRFGLIALASSLDQIGPITKTVEDAAIMFDTIKGGDDFDSTARRVSGADITRDGTEKLLIRDPKSITVGVPKEYFISEMENDVAREIEEARKRIEKAGFKMKEISLPHTKYALSVYYIIQPAEASSNLARFDGIRYARAKSDGSGTENLKELYFTERGAGFGEETKRRILLGTFVLSSGYYDAYYAKAQKVRELMKQDFDNVFKGGVDVIFSPVTPTRAFKIGEKAKDPVSMYLSDIFTIPASLAGLPAISIPVRNFVRGELPVGFQLIGKHFREEDILSVGVRYESGI